MRDILSLLAVVFTFTGALSACDDDTQTTGTSSVGGAGTAGSSANTSVGGATGSGGTGNVSLATSSLLSSVDTTAKAQALCEMLESRLNQSEYQRMVSGFCAVQGQMAAAEGNVSCQDAAAACVEDMAPATPAEEGCVPEDFPSCDNVTVQEFIDCTAALISASAGYFGSFTCASDLSAVEDELGTPNACTGPYARCPAMAGE